MALHASLGAFAPKDNAPSAPAAKATPASEAKRNARPAPKKVNRPRARSGLRLNSQSRDADSVLIAAYSSAPLAAAMASALTGFCFV